MLSDITLSDVQFMSDFLISAALTFKQRFIYTNKRVQKIILPINNRFLRMYFDAQGFLFDAANGQYSNLSYSVMSSMIFNDHPNYSR